MLFIAFNSSCKLPVDSYMREVNSMSDSIVITYCFNFDDGRDKTFSLQLDRKSLDFTVAKKMTFQSGPNSLTINVQIAPYQKLITNIAPLPLT